MTTLTDDFDQFWRDFPRKTAKLAARKAYDKARKIATAADILAGVDRYRTHKPAYADWCHPATFLSQGRWLDEYDTPPRAEAVNEQGEDWFTECQRLHGGQCNGRSGHSMQRYLDQQRAARVGATK